MIRLTGAEGIDKFVRDIELAFAQLDRDISDKFEKWTKHVFADIVYATPQWTGDLAHAWTYAINHIDASYSEIGNKVEAGKHWSKADVYSRGAEPAVLNAWQQMIGKHPTWRDVVYINNPAPIADDVENLRVLIRPVNLIDGRVAMVQYHVDKFNRGELQP